MNIHKTFAIIEDNKEIYDMLKHCPYEILREWEYSEYPKGRIVFRQGEVYPYFYIIIDGLADIYILAENGKKYSQAIYKKGNYIGELEIFDNQPYVCYVEALTDLKLIGIKRDYFFQWLELDRNFNSFIMKGMSKQFYRLSKKAGDDTLYSLKYRLLNFLIDGLSYGIQENDNVKINLDKNQISEQLAVTQRSINRILQYLKEKAIIDVNKNNIIIKDIEKLLAEKELSRFE